PRRAFPLDLHVLSTPPAFVLSQDQTLQQKPVEKSTPTIKENCRENNQSSGTGLSNTLLSSQETSARDSAPLTGACSSWRCSHYTFVAFAPSNRGSSPFDATPPRARPRGHLGRGGQLSRIRGSSRPTDPMDPFGPCQSSEHSPVGRAPESNIGRT